MVKIGVVSDIHGNKPALDAVLDDMPSDTVTSICLGDMVGVYGWIGDVITTVRAECSHIIKGNHDASVFLPESQLHKVLAAEKELFFEQTTDSQQSWLYELASLKEVRSYSALLAHSMPFEDKSLGLESGNSGVKPRDMVEVGSEFTDKLIMLGHTHEQHTVDLRDYGEHTVVVVNPGSVGSLYQETAEYAIIETDDWSVDLRSVTYDQASVVERIELVSKDVSCTLDEEISELKTRVS